MNQCNTKMNTFGLRTGPEDSYEIEGDTLVHIDTDEEGIYGDWQVSFCNNHISLYGEYEIIITGDIGDFSVEIYDDQSRTDHPFWSLGHKFVELLNRYIVDYTIEEFVRVFNYMIDTIEELMSIIDNFEVKGMHTNIKRAL